MEAAPSTSAAAAVPNREPQPAADAPARDRLSALVLEYLKRGFHRGPAAEQPAADRQAGNLPESAH